MYPISRSSQPWGKNNPWTQKTRILRYVLSTTAAAAGEFYALKGIRQSPQGSGLSRIAIQSSFEDTILLSPLEQQAVISAVQKLRNLFRSLSHGERNCFGISGRFTRTGAAYLGSDTHQGLDTPGPYLIMHLIQGDPRAPEFSVIGSSFPAEPGVVFGHNGKVAWAPTNGFADNGDFYIERFYRDREDLYVLRRNSPPVKTKKLKERFRIYRPHGFVDRNVTIHHISEWGPIFPLDALNIPLPFAISLRWIGFTIPVPPDTIFNFEKLVLSKIFCCSAKLLWTESGFCFADTTERVAYSYWTQTPLRERNVTSFSPLFLIPATVGPLWTGVIPLESVPYLIDPEKRIHLGSERRSRGKYL